jgi:colanic acid/amylovoran biosynthesis glycosyltransferase
MLTVAYLAVKFPSPVEPYVVDEIQQLERRGVRVIAGSVRQSSTKDAEDDCFAEITLQSWELLVQLQALLLLIRRWTRVSPLFARILFRGHENPWQRAKALLHTWLGVCYTVQLQPHTVDHIHVHHGYFASWIALVAARLLGIDFSMTLHGSDLLVRRTYLDTKLAGCKFCFTVSEYNRRFILENFPATAAEKVIVSRMGVDVSVSHEQPVRAMTEGRFSILAVGRLHPVKDHAFLVRACAQLRASGLDFECSIAGDGPERRRLQSLIRKSGMQNCVTLLGHVPAAQADSLYTRADLVVLTSRSEGIPLVLMEAMARGKIVLAPAITGIPELVIPGQTGFLYEPGSQPDFIARLLFIHSLLDARPNPDRYHPYILSAARELDWVRHAAQVQVRHHFNRKKNLESFADFFIPAVRSRAGSTSHADSLLQQIQLPIQRDRSLPVRTDGADAIAGTSGRPVLDV